MIAALDYYYYRDESCSKTLLPSDPTGQDFFKIFNPHLWDAICAPTPKPSEKTQWTRVCPQNKSHPIEPRNLWSRYKNPNWIMGVSFGKETAHVVFDLDAGSSNHPLNNEQLFKDFLGTLELIGLCRPIIVQSSDGGGLHVYYFLGWSIHSYTLVASIAQHLANHGYFLHPGQLEINPDTKAFNPKKPTSYRAIRLPLQTGSYVLDKDWQPIHNDIALFLEEAELSSSLQDMDCLIEAMGLAEEWIRNQNTRIYKERKMSASQFKFDLEEVIEEGWTGYGQTNDLLMKIAVYGVIFLSLVDKKLVDYIVYKAINSPGYKRFCRHQHEIYRRAREIGKWAHKYPYLGYPNIPVRDITYKKCKEFYLGDNKVVSINKNQQTQQKTLQKVMAVYQALLEEGTLPERVTARGKAIINKSKQLYGEGVSLTTLQKPKYLPIWYPQAKGGGNADLEKQGVTVSPERVTSFLLPDVWQELEEQKDLESLLGEYLSYWERYWWYKTKKERENQGLSQLHTPAIYEGMRQLLLSSSESAETDNSQKLGFENEALAEGKQDLEPALTKQNINQTGARINLIYNSILSQTVLTLINSITNYSNSLPKELSVNNLITQLINSNSLQWAPESNLVILINLNVLLYICTIILRLDNRHVLLSFTNERLDTFFSSVANQEYSSTTQQPFTATQQDQEQTQITLNENHIQADVKGVQAQIEGSTNPSSNPTQPKITNTSNNQQSIASNQAPAEVENIDNPLENNVIPPLQWQEARFKFSTLQEATHRLNTFCNTQGVSLLPQMRDKMRQFLQHCLMDKSTYPVLQRQAWEWFALHQDLINQIKDFTGFWEYFEDLLY